MELNILSATEVVQLNKLVDEAQLIIVTCHKSPDGDAMGASLAWTDYLTAQRGKKVTMVVPDAFPDFLRWLPGTERVVRYDKRKDVVEDLLSKADLVFCVDFNAMARVDEMEPVLTQAPGHKVMIDHHLNPDTSEVELVVSHPELSSASELVFRIMWQLGGFEDMSRNCASQIYCGMMTDTGGFTYNSSSPETYFIISQLLTKRINKDKIYRNVYHNYSESRLRLVGHVLCNRLVVDAERHAAYYTLSREDQKKFHFVKGDAEGIVNMPLQIKGLRLSISLREDTGKDNVINVSLRSVDDFPCNSMAADFFNGGGHLNASGGKLHGTLEDAVKVVEKALVAYEGKLK